MCMILIYIMVRLLYVQCYYEILNLKLSILKSEIIVFGKGDSLLVRDKWWYEQESHFEVVNSYTSYTYL